MKDLALARGAAEASPARPDTPPTVARRLLEFGFVEGAVIEVLHEGAIRRDPIAVRLDDMRVALRRRDADEVLFALDAPAA